MQSPGKSYLFFLTARIGLGSRLSGEEAWRLARARQLLACPVHSGTARENPGEGIAFATGRTHNRSRSPR